MTPWLTPWLAPLGADALEQPARLWPLLAVAAAALLFALRRPLPAYPWPALAEASGAGARRVDPLRGAALLLRGAALVSLALVVAAPVGTARVNGNPTEGLDLVLVLDVSGSMRAVDAEMYGEPRTRLDLAREVVTRFALHRVAAGDRVGLVVFGGRAYTQLPLTTDGRLLESALARIAPAGPNEPTALGDGLALAVRRVSAGSAGPTATAEPLAGRLVVLLTDGRNNAGAIPIDVAAGIAIAKRIRVHTVGIGAERGSGGGPPAADADGGRPTDLDADTLERVAELTRGRFFHARSTRDLGAVYAEIDALERVPRATPDPIRTTPRPEGLLLAAGTLLLVEIAAARVLLRRIP